MFGRHSAIPAGEFKVAGHVVVVEVGLEHVGQAQAALGLGVRRSRQPAVFDADSG